jgi:hypothetical protein
VGYNDSLNFKMLARGDIGCAAYFFVILKDQKRNINSMANPSESFRKSDFTLP